MATVTMAMLVVVLLVLLVPVVLSDYCQPESECLKIRVSHSLSGVWS